ncbi:MAG TPA: hypothetical protein VED59_04270, partial [Acidimicrobiales bacterium]|nr:hypothetical protein [Acidimicrobiales bacterium]
LELRQLPGVSYVGLGEHEGTMLIELLVSVGTEQEKVRDEAARCASNHLEETAEIRILTQPRAQPVPTRGGRVKLALVLPSEGEAFMEVHLTRGSQRCVRRAVAGDTVSVGRAVLEALRGLGAHAPFEISGIHALSPDWGAGVLAVLRDTATGDLRRGLASGHSPGDAAARAVLAALNRFL